MHYEVENKQPISVTRKDSRKSTSFSIQNNYLGIRKTLFLKDVTVERGIRVVAEFLLLAACDSRSPHLSVTIYR